MSKTLWAAGERIRIDKSNELMCFQYCKWKIKNFHDLPYCNLFAKLIIDGARVDRCLSESYEIMLGKNLFTKLVKWAPSEPPEPDKWDMPFDRHPDYDSWDKARQDEWMAEQKKEYVTKYAEEKFQT